MSEPASYRQELEREAQHWGNRLKVETVEASAWLDHPLVAGHYRTRGLVDGLRWEEWITARLGAPPEKSMELGCGSASRSMLLFENGWSRWVDGIDVSPDRVAEGRRRRADRQAPGEFRVGDANALELPRNTYDLVFSCHSFHHFEALEHVMEQVLASLTPRGFFVLEEFVGPTQFQWTDRQIDLVRALTALLPERLRQLRWGAIKPYEGRPTTEDVVTVSPFESIRSGEIVPLFERYFDVVTVRNLGGTLQHESRRWCAARGVGKSMATTRRTPSGSPVPPPSQETALPGGSLASPQGHSGEIAGATAEELLRRQVIALQRISSLGVLAGGVFHELNNALTPILSYAKLGLRNPDPAYRERALTQIVAASQRATAITRGMLGLTRPGSGLNHREPTDVARLVDEVVLLVKKDLARYRVRLNVMIAGTPTARVNPAQIQQVLLNLLINARQAMPEGGVVQLRAGTDATGRLVELSVADTGVGIAAGDLRRIFEPFYSTKMSPDPAGQGGTGLGLAVCRDIVEAHHGRLRAESRPGKGSTFTMILPACAPPASGLPIARDGAA